MQEKIFKIVNALNHNALLCQSKDTKEIYVFFGKGIGYKRKSGEEFVSDENVKDALLVLPPKEAEQYKELIHKVELKKLIELVQNIVNDAHEVFGGKINSQLHLTLLDHLNFAIERQKNNLVMNYPFLNELKFMYPKEYDFSIDAYNYLNEQLQGIVKFEESEIGFLTLHIHAAVTNSKVSKVLNNSEIIHATTQVIEEFDHKTLDKQSIYYSRFIKHLEYAIQRYHAGIQLQNVMLESIKETCKEDYIIANQINNLLNRKYRIQLDENEIGYLTLHIFNLRNKY